ncbi:MAG: hypothetical protein IIZ96_04910 [Oscillospiraceae bacterium]|nr:hypothetical protein [Oscillospiraceae bacterium]
MSYQSDYSGAQVDEAVGKALNPDAAPTANSTNLVTSGGVASAVSAVQNTVSRRNLLDNAYFVGGGSQQGGGQFPINQRGQTTYSNAGYGIDRWIVNGDGSLALNTGYISLETRTMYGGFTQRFEEGAIKDGSKLTLSVLTDTGLYSVTFTAIKTTPYASDTTWLGVSGLYAYFGWYSSGGVQYWQIYIVDNADGQSHTVNLIAAKLEMGADQTLAHQENGVWVLNDIPNYAEELAKCQYYFYRLKAGEPLYGSRSIGGVNFSSFRVPVIMRATPTVTKNGGTITIYGQNGAQFGFSSFNNSNIDYNAIGVNLSQNGAYAGEKYVLFNAGGTLDLSADL